MLLFLHDLSQIFLLKAITKIIKIYTTRKGGVFLSVFGQRKFESIVKYAKFR